MTRRILAGAILVILAITVFFEWRAGRTFLGPDGRLGFGTSDIWSSACSQRILDPYSFSHICHGFIFYFLLWLVARWTPLGWRYSAALALEAGWEILENSPIIIERYRQATIAIGYSGDSILNSMSDILMMSLGFCLAWKLRPWTVVVLFLATEIGCAVWLRDNLSLNVLMLLKPVPAIKKWQEQARQGK